MVGTFYKLSHYSTQTTSTKMNKLKNQELYFDSWEKLGHQANCSPHIEETGGYRELQLSGAETHEEKPLQEP